jgi:hypothetical protein
MIVLPLMHSRADDSRTTISACGLFVARAVASPHTTKETTMPNTDLSPLEDQALQQRGMLADLARRMADQAIAIAELAKLLAERGDEPGARRELGRSLGYSDCAKQVLLIAKSV